MKRNQFAPLTTTPSTSRLLSVAALSGVLVGSALATQNVYVSPTGKDTNDGKTSKTPVATLAKAVGVMMNLRKYKTVEDGVIWMAPGNYPQTTTTYFDAYSSNLTVQSTIAGQYPRLTGGITLTNGAPVTDPSLLARMPAASRSTALQFPLTPLGTTVGSFNRRAGNDYQGLPSPMELYFSGMPGKTARYPNTGWIGLTPIAGQTGTWASSFKYSDPRIDASAGDKNAMAHGYWANLWSDSIHPVSSINPTTDTVTFAGQGSYYGFDPVGKWRIENALAELDTPGEYYLDKDSNSVIALVPAGTSEILASVMEKPLISITGATNLKFSNLAFAAGRGSAAVLWSGDYNTFDSCIFKNFGLHGVEIQGGHGNGVSSCVFNHMGECCVWLTGGDRVSLTPGGNYVQDSSFQAWSLDVRASRPAVKLMGVGNRISRCTMADAPAQAVMISGNNNVVENSEISNVVNESGDCGAIYIGYNITERGNIIRNNLIHDVRTPKGFPLRAWENYALYLDDLSSGTTVTGNVVTDCSAGLIIGGGRDNNVSKNVFNNVDRPVLVDGRGKTFRAGYYAAGGKMSKDVAEVNAFGPTYTAAYPELKTLLSTDYASPNNTISNSTAQSDFVFYYDQYAKTAGYSLKNNLLGYDPRFYSPATYDFRLRPGSPALSLGLSQITKASVGVSVATAATVDAGDATTASSSLRP